MSLSSDANTPPRTGQHRQGFSISSILSFLSSDAPVTPIRTVRHAPSASDESSPRTLLPATRYPDSNDFSARRLLEHVNTQPLQDAIEGTVGDLRISFSTTTNNLVSEQLNLIKKMHATDAQVKKTLQVTNSRVKKTEKEAELLANSEKLSILAETCFEEVSKILKLFAEVDALLPANERIREHSSHYPELSKCVKKLNRPRMHVPTWKSTSATSAITSLKSVRDGSPASSSAASLTTLRSDAIESVTTAPTSSPAAETTSQAARPRLRLAPRKSRSNLRLPQIRTIPPLPTTRLDTVFPNVERDNFSTRSSVASRASVFSTVSQFFMGPSSRRTVHEASSLGPRQVVSAEERLRKISGSSPITRSSRTVSSRF